MIPPEYRWKSDKPFLCASVSSSRSSAPPKVKEAIKVQTGFKLVTQLPSWYSIHLSSPYTFLAPCVRAIILLLCYIFDLIVQYRFLSLAHRFRRMFLQLPHVDDGADAISLLHRLECVVNLAKSLAVRDELVNLESPVLVVADKAGQLRASLDAAKGAALPDTTGDKLERYRLLVHVTRK